MAEPWIRVHANLRAKPVVGRVMDALGVKRAEAIGLLVSFWGGVSQHAENGSVEQLSDTVLEDWAGWTGKRGKFAAFVREQHIDAEGRVNEWDDYQGPLETRRVNARERQRRHRKKGVTSHEESVTVTRDTEEALTRDTGVTSPLVTHSRARTERNGTERNEVEAVVGESSNRRSSTAPLASASSPTDPLELPGVVRFLARFYGRATEPRLRDVRHQLASLMSPYGAPHPRAPADRVKALSRERLEGACLDVLHEGVKDHDKAIVVLLIKLADTSDVTEDASANTRREIVDDAIARGRDLAHAEAWLATLDAPPPELALVFNPDQFHTGVATAVQLLERESKLLAVWRRAGAPVAAGAHP